MKTRIIIHYYSGKTWIGDWNNSDDFKKLNNSPISSLQIQEGNGKHHTLSLKRKQINSFWQRDYKKDDKLISRSIFRRLSKDIWLELNLDCDTGKRKVIIIKEDIKG